MEVVSVVASRLTRCVAASASDKRPLCHSMTEEWGRTIQPVRQLAMRKTRRNAEARMRQAPPKVVLSSQTYNRY